MLDLCLDLETQDPDDVLTLCLVAAHPDVRLLAVTITPGSDEQVGLVRRVLARAEHPDVPIGALDPGTGRPYVSGFHHKWLGRWAPDRPDGLPAEVVAAVLAERPRATLLTGGPPHNLARLLETGVHPARWVAQGGFAGDSLVPPGRRLPKFDGREVCPTFNFNGAPAATLRALAAPIGRRELVSKNVTHGVRYDRDFHERLAAHRTGTPGLRLLHEAMDLYLRRKPTGKLLHDPVAACAAIDPGIAHWAEAEIYRTLGGWGARATSGTGTFITTGLRHDRFFETLAAPQR